MVLTLFATTTMVHSYLVVLIHTCLCRRIMYTTPPCEHVHKIGLHDLGTKREVLITNATYLPIAHESSPRRLKKGRKKQIFFGKISAQVLLVYLSARRICG
jgi:hypothetical protein